MDSPDTRRAMIRRPCRLFGKAIQSVVPSRRECQVDPAEGGEKVLFTEDVQQFHRSPRSRRITIDSTNTGSLFIAMELRMKMTRDGQRRARSSWDK
jgi:hypothetical protein